MQSGFGTGFQNLSHNIQRSRPLVYLHYFDKVTDLSIHSFAFLITSSHKPQAYEDRQNKVKGSLLFEI